MTLNVVYDAETGLASLQPSLPLPIGQDLRFSLQDTRSRLYLTPSGWSPTRKTLFRAHVTDDNSTLHLDQAVTSLLTSGTPLLLEEIYVNYREAFVWPHIATEPAVSPMIEAEEPPEPEAEQPVAAVEAATTEIPDRAEEPSPVIAPSPTQTQTEIEDSPGIRWRMWSAAALVLLLCVAAASWLSREGETQLGEQAASAEQAEAVTTGNPPPPPPSTDGGSETAEINRLKSEIAALEATAVQRNSELNLANIELTDLRRRAAEFDEQLRLARLTPTPTYKPSAELMAQVEQQKATIISLQKQLSEAPRDTNLAETERTLKLLQDRNAQLTEETARQKATITLMQEREQLRAQAEELKREYSGPGPENTYDAGASVQTGTWLGVAVSRSGSVEVAVNQSSSQTALQAAETLCREKGGQGCRALETYAEGCVAVARQRGARILPNNYWFDNGLSSMSAMARAERQCEVSNRGEWTCETAFVKCSQ